MAITPEWAGVVNATATRYLKGASNETIRKRILLAMLESKGRIKYGETGTQVNWDVQFDQIGMEAYADMGQITFEPHDLLRQLAIDWRGYILTDQYSEKQVLMNKDPVAIVNRYAKATENLMDSARARFGPELYVDGYATNNQNRIHGLESFMGTGTCAVGDRIAQPSDSYAGKNTNLADQGGTWTAAGTTFPNSTIATDWPDGSGDTAYDYLAPKQGNWSSNAWGTGSVTWEDNCERVMRQMNIWLQSTGGEDGKADMALLARELYYGFLNKEASKQRITVPFAPAEELGFTGAINFEGLGLMHDFDVPANTGYIFNFDKMELLCLYDQLFFPRGPEFDIKTNSYLMLLGFFGNARYRPKHFGKIKNYAAA